MRKVEQYSLEIPSDTPKTFEGLKSFIESMPEVFEEAVMSQYAHDQRYSYFSDNFEVVDIDEGSFTFEVDVQYYEGCKGKDDVTLECMTVEYEIKEGCLEFELDETVWRTDN